MVKKILHMFHKEISGVHQAALLLGAFTLASQVLALVRDRLLAYQFGAGQVLDLYYTAFRIPDLIYAGIASLVSISVLIPFFSAISEEKKEEGRKLLSSIFTVFILVMALVSLVAFFFMPYLVRTFFSTVGNVSEIETLILLSRVLLLQPICLGISNVFGVVTQLGKRFFLYALSPIFYNLSIIFGIIFLYPSFGIVGVVYGVVIGGILHFAIQIPYVSLTGMLPFFTTKIDFAVIKRVVQISIPRTIALSANMFELIAITAIASLLTTGSVAIFNLALNLQSVPFAIVGVSYTLAAFPTLSAYFAKGEHEKFMKQISTAARHIIFWSLPITVLFVVLRAQIVRTILGSGQFNWEDTRLTAACLALFAVSLIGQSLELLFIRGYYAAGRTAKPLFVNIISSCITIGAPYLLVQYFNSSAPFRYFIEGLFKVEGIPGTAVLMLPLGYTIGTLVNMSAFWILFTKDFGPLKSAFNTLVTSFEAGVCGGFVAYVGLNLFSGFFLQSTVTGVFMHGFVSGILGIITTIGVFTLLESEELSEVWNAMKQKVSRSKVVISEPDKIEV